MNRFLPWGRSTLCARPWLIQHRGSKTKSKNEGLYSFKYFKLYQLDVPGSTESSDEVVDDAAASVDLTRVCAGLNYFQTGEDPPIRDDSEYPDWLANIIEPVKSYKELSPDTKQYWRRFNKVKARENNFASKQLKR